jgi:hypothetical protein
MKDVEGSGYDLNKVLYWHLPAVTADTWYSAEIQTKQHLNTSLENYCYTNVLSTAKQ